MIHREIFSLCIAIVEILGTGDDHEIDNEILETGDDIQCITDLNWYTSNIDKIRETIRQSDHHPIPT